MPIRNNIHNIMFCPDLPLDKDYFIKKVLGKNGAATIIYSVSENLTVIHEIVLKNHLHKTVTNTHHDNVNGIAIVTSAVEDILNGTQTVRFGTQQFNLNKLSPFRRRVLQETLNIEYGETCSYSSLAERAGNRGAVRATGTAMATNPFPLIIPCHRIIKSDGKIGNYGGGVDMKQKLLKSEGVVLA